MTGKLKPYTIHKNWYDEVDWKPTPDGQVLNNDFFGGNFRGITEKMDYIADLGAVSYTHLDVYKRQADDTEAQQSDLHQIIPRFVCMCGDFWSVCKNGCVHPENTCFLSENSISYTCSNFNHAKKPRFRCV